MGGGGGAFFNSSLLANQLIPSGFSPLKIGSVLFAHFFREQGVYTLHHLIGGRFRVHRNHTYNIIRITAPVELDEEPPYELPASPYGPGTSAVSSSW